LKTYLNVVNREQRHGDAGCQGGRRGEDPLPPDVPEAVDRERRSYGGQNHPCEHRCERADE
jgi:hypothetical protein